MAGYIGSRASVVSSGAERKKTFDITGTTTSLTGLSYTVNQVHVFHNGVRLVDGTDFTATDGNSITLTSAAESGDEVVVVSYAGYQVSDTVSASQGGTFAGALDVNASSATVLTVDRTGSDGTILDLKKDGSTVGQIGTGLSGGSEFGIKSNTGELQLASSYNSNTVTWDGSQLYPSSTNNLGHSSAKWQDLYLSNDIKLDRNSTVAWPDGAGAYATLIGATNHVTAGYTSADLTYWNLISSKGGTHVVLNTDGGRSNSRNHHDHFSVWQKAADQTNGRLAFSVDNGGQAFFGAAGVGIDRQWDNYPCLTVYRDSANGNDNAAGSEFRLHGANVTTAWWHGGASGADFSVNFRIDGSTYISSDRRKKSDITPITNALDTVKQLEGKRFQVMNSDGTVFDQISDTGYKLGFIAQEVEQVVPDAVRYYTDEDDGTDGYNNAYSVDYASMVPLLTSAIKEQQAIIEALEARLTALEAV